MITSNIILVLIGVSCFSVGVPLNCLALCYFRHSPSSLVLKIFTLISAIDACLCGLILTNAINILTEEPGLEAAMFCRVVSWIWNILSKMSLYLTGLLSVTRAVSMCKPFTNIPTKPVLVTISLMLCYLVLFECSSTFTGQRVYVYHRGNCDWTVGDWREAKPYQIFYSLTYYTPVIATLTSSVISYLALRRNRVKFHALAKEDHLSYQSRCYASQTIFMIVIIYGFCNIPYVILLMMYDLGIVFGWGYMKTIDIRWTALYQALGSVYLVVVNATLTPFVFLSRLRGFRNFVKNHIRNVAEV